MPDLQPTFRLPLFMPQAAPAPVLDLSTCDKEPIRTPGSIQPHGFLLTLAPDLAVLQASANLAAWSGMAAEDAIGRPLADVIGAAAAQRLAPELAADRGPHPYYLGTVGTANDVSTSAQIDRSAGIWPSDPSQRPYLRHTPTRHGEVVRTEAHRLDF